MPATIVKEKLKVSAISTKFGNGAIGVSTGEVDDTGRDKLEFISFNKNVNVPVTDLEKGGVYEFELSIADNGKRYVNKVLSLQEGGAVPPKAAVKGKKKAASNVTTTGDGKEAYWVAKNDSQKLGGLFHDAATITAAIIQSNPEYDVVEEFNKVLNIVIDARKKFD